MLNKMKSMLMKKKADQKRKGFTLIELMVAMSIVILLGAAAFFSYGHVQQTRKVAQMNMDMDAIATACLTYESLNIAGAPPESLAALQSGLSAENSIDGAAHTNMIQGGKSSANTGSDVATLKDPWNNDYNYDQNKRQISCTPLDQDNKTKLTTVIKKF